MTPAPLAPARAVVDSEGDFALILRAGRNPQHIEWLRGSAIACATLGEAPLHDGADAETLMVVPFAQARERGFECVDDGVPLLAMPICERRDIDVDEFMRVADELPQVALCEEGFDLNDGQYGAAVDAVVEEEIGAGSGCNFVIRRDFHARFKGDALQGALRTFSELLRRETGAYWTFLVSLGDYILVGASPERHISVSEGSAHMTAISGTYRYPREENSIGGVMEFLQNPKEVDELFMVVDEELKMMSRVCATAPQVTGPRLRQMTRVAHTEYEIRGATLLDAREVLRETLFAPTVTGSPVENAFRVIVRHERGGRGYYSGVLALLGRCNFKQTLDSTIMIRTAEICRSGEVKVSVGSTIVRHSQAADEVAETTAKAQGLLDAMRPGGRSSNPPRERLAQLADDAKVRDCLKQRNSRVSPFWVTDALPIKDIGRHRILLLDAEDTFTSMIATMLRAEGHTVDVQPVLEARPSSHHDLVLLGPGPGDPTDLADPRVARLCELAAQLIAARRPFLAVCLSHQVVASLLGLPVRRCSAPHQGHQQSISFFGKSATVGFYNSWAAFAEAAPPNVEVSCDPVTGEVHALRGVNFSTFQFHPESLLSVDGHPILVDEVVKLLQGCREVP